MFLFSSEEHFTLDVDFSTFFKISIGFVPNAQQLFKSLVISINAHHINYISNIIHRVTLLC